MSLEWILFGLRLAAAGLLYTFLGTAFYIIWRDLRQTAGFSAEQPPRFCLRVVSRPAEDQPNGEFPLLPVTLIGRGPDNTIILNRPSVSARHARLEFRRGTWWVEDLGSRNGVLLNDLPISRPTPLEPGDVIGIGEVRLRLVEVSS